MAYPSMKVTMREASPLSKEQARKRVARACDRCRLKKGKCDGKEQCAKCITADVMCIYTDRKPPQHKSISPAVAEALQSENLTLKKATIVIFKELMKDLPKINGVDWNSEKVLSGKSGRALNHIIQHAGVDNRISNEEIMNYDSDSHEHRSAPDSPLSRGSSPHVFGAESTAGSMWPYEQPVESAPRPKRSRTTGVSYANSASPHSSGAESEMPLTQGSVFIDPNLLQPLYGQAPPTPPDAFDTMEYSPEMDTVALKPQNYTWTEQQQHPRFYNSGNLILQRCETPESSGLMSNSPVSVPMADAEFYQFLGAPEPDISMRGWARQTAFPNGRG